MQNKRTFAGRFFELFTLPASLGGGTERPYFCDINKRNYRVQNNCQLLASRFVCNWRVQPCDSYLEEKCLSLTFCLFILFIYFVIRISIFFSSYFFGYPHFFYPHFPIRIHHPHPTCCSESLRFLASIKLFVLGSLLTIKDTKPINLHLCCSFRFLFRMFRFTAKEKKSKRPTEK